MRVLVIGGGISDEREVSLRSSKSVYEALSAEHTKELYDWQGEKEWLYQHANDFDVALPILHGIGGEDGQIQSILEEIGMPYLGSNSRVSKVCIDKVQTQTALRHAGVLVPGQAEVNQADYFTHTLSENAHVLKPILGGSSLDTFVLQSGKLAEEQAEAVFSKYNTMILEEYIAGREITVPVLDGQRLPVIEIIPPEGVFFDYENKYNGKSQEICQPETIDMAVQNEAQYLAIHCHEILGCRHISRVDIILTDTNKLYVLEINTIPGLTDQSLFPKAAAHTGMSMPQLVENFVQMAASGAKKS